MYSIRESPEGCNTMSEEASTEEHVEELLKELETVTPEERKRQAKIRRFEELRMKRLGVPEWKLLLALAYGGPQNMYQIGKNYDIKYPVVHRAAKALKAIRWIKLLETRKSEKNVETKIYGLTREGLLWLLSKIPKTYHPSLIYSSENDSLSLRKTLETKDTSKVKNLENQNDIYLHLLLDFKVDEIAKNNTKLLPLIFENWDLYKRLELAQSITGEFPEAAFSTLVHYYCDYPLSIQLGSLDKIFTYRLFQSFLELYANGYANVDDEYGDEMVEKTAKAFQGNPQLQRLFQQTTLKIEARLIKRLAFIKKIRKNAERTL